jgi:predicted NACHT family NTPase
MNDSKRSLQEHLIETLARNDFPNAENFLSQSLKQGTLMLLFDGLDEVNRIERNRVVREIKDLLEKYRQCRVLITCRTAVYKGEFDDGVDRIMEISDFSDQQIRRFLSSWEPDMPPDKSIKQLMNTLHDRPKIMALARNPLLLTIIAYLYTDTPYVLPHSRAEFYRQSTDVLLRQWHQERNKYEARNKRLILQHLALYNQDGTDKHFQDRRSMDYKEVIQQVKIVLPQLNLNPEQDTIPIINEIIERSGLLLSIDIW